MKNFKEVEATRRAYHADATLNSVHRSSLLVPELPNSSVEISFLNHFLIKRDFKKVACRVTAIDPEGKRIESRLHPVTEPRVYTIPLTGMVESEVATYLVEFFAAENLFIPFPAVMVNHRGDGFINTVHAFNRVLNDVFEEDAVNATSIAEASIDVSLGDDIDTVAYFMAGQQPCKGDIELELSVNGETSTAKVPVDVARFQRQPLSLKQAFSGINTDGGVLKIRQPQQFMFYGRMFVAMERSDGSFSGNHSYYDMSHVEEYWDDAQPSTRIYPFFQSFENKLRMYPIMSPGELDIAVEFFNGTGESQGTANVGRLKNPSSEYLDFSIDEGASSMGIERSDISGFVVSATPMNGNTPTRVNHQLVYCDRGENSQLAASVNVSLFNPNIFQPKKKKGLTWGQATVGGDVSTTLGIVRNFPEGDTENVQVCFYSEAGEILVQDYELPPTGSIILDVADLVSKHIDTGPGSDPHNIWYEVRSERPDISAFVASRHGDSGHCTGEHSY
jgi:hypothetical protein